MAKYIIQFKEHDTVYGGGMFLNYEWRNGRKHPESAFSGFYGQLMSESRKDYFVEMLTNNGALFNVITIVK